MTEVVQPDILPPGPCPSGGWQTGRRLCIERIRRDVPTGGTCGEACGMADNFGEGTAFYEEHRKAWGHFTRWGLRIVILSAILTALAFWLEA